MSNVDEELCKEVMALDGAIRFAAIVNNLGKIVASEYRKGQIPLLTREESELSAAQSILRMGLRKALESKLGRTVYAFAMYENRTYAVGASKYSGCER